MVTLFYCFMNAEVQNTLRHHFQNWKTKKSLRQNRLRSSSRSKDWSPRSRTESLRITECTLVGADDELEEDDDRHSAKLRASPLNQTKESLLPNSRKESFSREPLLRRFSNESVNVAHPHAHNTLLHPGRKCNSDVQVNRDTLNPNRDVFLAQRKESLVNQPLLEQSEDSPTGGDSKIGDFGGMYPRVTLMVDERGTSVVVPNGWDKGRDG